MNKRLIKANKIDEVTHLKQYFINNMGIALFANNGINANEINDVRKKARKAGIQTFISKNTLWKIAFQESIKNFDSNFNLSGKLVAFISENAMNSVGFAEELSKSEKKLLIPMIMADKNGIIIDKGQIQKIAKAKNMKGLMAFLLITMRSPTIKLVKILTLIKDKQ